MFHSRRSKIREVEVEVLSPGDAGFVPPAELEPTADGVTELRPAAGARPRTRKKPPASHTTAQAKPRRPKRPKRQTVEPEQPLAASVEAGAAAVPAPLRPHPTQHAAELVEVPGPVEPAEAVDAREPDEAEEAAAPTPALGTELVCEILFWRGYRKSAFFARIFDDTGEPLAVAESPFFRSRGNGNPERTEESEAAYEELRKRLERDGWTRVDQGPTWYGDVFSQEITAAGERERE